MNVLEKMNKAIDYIESNLTSDIDYKEVALHAMCSEYHFKRMFSFLSGVALSEYIRRRRLTLAGLELMSSNARIIDIALKYQYNSPDSFARAFKGLHGMTPSDARKAGQVLKAYPRMSFQLTIRGGQEMNYRIVEKEPFHIVGLKKRVPLIYQGVNPKIEKMWQSLTPEAIETLKSLSDIEPLGMISASTNFTEGREEFGELDHYIGVATSQSRVEPFAELQVDALTWAVFTSIGPFPETLQDLWGRIYAEWFPSSQYQQANGPELLWNEHHDTSSPQYKSEIWIPIVK